MFGESHAASRGCSRVSAHSWMEGPRQLPFWGRTNGQNEGHGQESKPWGSLGLEQGHKQEGHKTNPGVSLSLSFSFVFLPLYTWGQPRACWGQVARAHVPLSTTAWLLSYLCRHCDAGRQINEAKPRPCTRGLALFLGDQALEPKLTLTTPCVHPLVQGRGKRKGIKVEGRGEEKWEKGGEGERKKEGQMG